MAAQDGKARSRSPPRTRAAPRTSEAVKEKRSYVPQKVLGTGAFGVVHQALVKETGEVVAIKCTPVRKEVKDRELQILKELAHPNVVALKGAFLTEAAAGEGQTLNVIMEYIPDTLHRVVLRASGALGAGGCVAGAAAALGEPQGLKLQLAALYAYQMLRGLAYVHSKAICHRDVKPQNMLVSGCGHVLKLCDFGTAKRLELGEVNRAYVCSRYYRAPELLLGATDYTTAVDIWSAGCVLAEMVAGKAVFAGRNGVDQLVEIIRVLGTPSADELQAMNPKYPAYVFPTLERRSWGGVLGRTSPELEDLLGQLLRYAPRSRLRPLYALMHCFFDELRAPPHGAVREDLFDFREDELLFVLPEDRPRLLPRRS